MKPLKKFRIQVDSQYSTYVQETYETFFEFNQMIYPFLKKNNLLHQLENFELTVEMQNLYYLLCRGLIKIEESSTTTRPYLYLEVGLQNKKGKTNSTS